MAGNEIDSDLLEAQRADEEGDADDFDARLDAIASEQSGEEDDGLQQFRDAAQAHKDREKAAQAQYDEQWKSYLESTNAETPVWEQKHEPDGEIEQAAHDLAAFDPETGKDNFDPEAIRQISAMYTEKLGAQERAARALEPGFDEAGEPIAPPEAPFDPNTLEPEAFRAFIDAVAGRPMQRVPAGFSRTQWDAAVRSAQGLQ